MRGSVLILEAKLRNYGADEYARLLRQTGFVSATIEPKTIYSRDVLRKKAERKDRLAHFERIADADIDSKTGSFIIVARKMGQ